LEIQVNRNIFQTTIYDIQTEFNLDSTLSFIKNYSFDKEDMLTTFYDCKNIFDKSEQLNDFYNHLKQYLTMYTKQILNKNDFKITRSWIQCYAEGHHHGLHAHGREIHEHSLIYYIQCSDDSTSTTFYQPGHPYCEGPEMNISPAKNKMVLFPSYVPHEVKPNKDKSRIVLSANISIL
jgi:hypothetical protein|tara:strand:+ start:532 stop:1065 length:534 start_codon:yes stop_codon:yes gene_type:complete